MASRWMDSARSQSTLPHLTSSRRARSSIPPRPGSSAFRMILRLRTEERLPASACSAPRRAAVPDTGFVPVVHDHGQSTCRPGLQRRRAAGLPSSPRAGVPILRPERAQNRQGYAETCARARIKVPFVRPSLVAGAAIRAIWKSLHDHWRSGGDLVGVVRIQNIEGRRRVVRCLSSRQAARRVGGRSPAPAPGCHRAVPGRGVRLRRAQRVSTGGAGRCGHQQDRGQKARVSGHGLLPFRNTPFAILVENVNSEPENGSQLGTAAKKTDRGRGDGSGGRYRRSRRTSCGCSNV